MPHEDTHHDAILEAVRRSGILSELLDKEDGHYKHELDLELVVYGRNYGGKQIGPYARLLFYEPGEVIIREGEWGDSTFYVLVEGLLEVSEEGDRQLGRKSTEIGPRTPFGVRAFLSGERRCATITVPPLGGAAKVLEIKRPAFRLLYQLEGFRRLIGEEYRQHGLKNTLNDIEEASKKPYVKVLREELESAARLAVYAKGHALFEEGDDIVRIIFIRNGWVRRVRRIAPGRRAAHNPTSDTERGGGGKSGDQEGLDFLGAGNWLGLETVCEKNQFKWKYSATVMARTEVLEIDTARVRANPALGRMISEYFPSFSKADDMPPQPPADKMIVVAARNEIEEGVIDGTNLLVMDMDKCVRCGNCSMACQKVHGHSRLVRRGIHIERPKNLGGVSSKQILVPQVCMHCQDPECLTGCPTGAIGRRPEGYVDVNRETCIGCGDCAAQCPYDAISMIPLSPSPSPRRGDFFKSWFDLTPAVEPPDVEETKNMLAAKCNLCENTPLNPKGAKGRVYSCEENCPTGALVRVNPLEYFAEATRGLGLVVAHRTQAIGRNIHRQDVPACRIHWVGALTTAVVAGAALLGAAHYTLDGRIGGTLLTVRWITGLVGLACVAGLMSYLWRKRQYKRRAGPLRYWMLAHVYLGLAAGFVLLIHAGRDSGGLLTSLLAVSFDLAIASGLFGIVCYLGVPRLLTQLEGDPVLLEDLHARRDELRRTLSLFDTRSDELRRRIGRKMRRRFFSFGYLMRQYMRREELKELVDEACDEFEADAVGLDDEGSDALNEAVEAATTLRRVDSLIYLYRLLKLWLVPHVVSVSVMLALMVVHIIQVTLFTVR